MKDSHLIGLTYCIKILKVSTVPYAK
ncbi:hypothetical protein SLEP1_g60376, partial [Rubroshorea leprosula]